MRHLAAALSMLGVLTGCGDTSDAEPGAATVDRVVDGDTVVVDLAGGPTETVRLLGIDTPESVDPRRPVECFGPEASARLTELLPEGTQIRITRDVEARDRFGRLLAYVHRADDDLFVNLDLITTGHAEVLVIAPNGAHRDELTAAESAARAAGAGQWSACAGQ